MSDVLTIDIKGLKTMPFKDEKGQVLSDPKFIDKALEKIDEYQTKYGKPAPVPARFVDWMREVKAHCDNKGDVVKYKEQTIQRSTSDYNIYVDNTNKLNRRK